MADNLGGLLAETELTLLDGSLERTEGPLWHPGGYLTFVDLAREQLLKWDPNTGETTVVREHTGEGNGCTFDRQGNLPGGADPADQRNDRGGCGFPVARAASP